MSLKKKKRVAFLITSLVLAVAAFTCLIVEYAIFKEFTWSLLACGGIAIAFVSTIPYLIFDKTSNLIGNTILALALVPYLYLIEWFTKGQWATKFALPILIASYIFTILTNYVYTKAKIKKDTATMIVLALLIPLTLFIQYLINIHYPSEYSIINMVTTPMALLITIAALGIKKYAQSDSK